MTAASAWTLRFATATCKAQICLCSVCAAAVICACCFHLFQKSVVRSRLAALATLSTTLLCQIDQASRRVVAWVSLRAGTLTTSTIPAPSRSKDSSTQVQRSALAAVDFKVTVPWVSRWYLLTIPKQSQYIFTLEPLRAAWWRTKAKAKSSPLYAVWQRPGTGPAPKMPPC